MALTYLTVTILNPKNGKQAFNHRFLVDSGAIYTAVPAKILKSLKVTSIDKQEFILANGEQVVKDIGEVQVELFGRRRTVPVIFGDEDVFLLGATTLEVFGLMLDPLKRQVKQLPMVI